MTAPVKVRYFLNEEGRKDSLLNGGNGKQEQELLVYEASAELINMSYVNEAGFAMLDMTQPERMATLVVESDGKPVKVAEKQSWQLVMFNKVQTVESLIQYKKDMAKSLKESKEELEKKLPEMMEAYEKAKAEHEQEKQKRLEEEKAHKAKSQTIIDERNKWIADNGSDYLIDCTSLGYKCNKEYVLERALDEFPEFYVDYQEDADFEKILSPEQKSLDVVKALKEKGIDAVIKWLDEPLEVYYAQLEEGKMVYHETVIRAGEVIEIEKFLNKYSLIRCME